MGRTNRNNGDNQNNDVPKHVFPPNAISRTCSVVLLIIIDLVAVYYAFENRNGFTQDILMDVTNIGFTVVLAIVALAITVFQTDKELLERRNLDENVRKIYLSYVFGVFPIILILVLGYLVAYVCKDDSYSMCLYFIITILALTKCVTGTMTAFVAFLNIRD